MRRRQERRGALNKGLRQVGRDYVSVRREQKRKDNICILEQKGRSALETRTCVLSL